MNEDVENKVKGILGLYNFYKYQMNTIQRIGLLSLWIEVSIDKEEYEVAAGLQKELEKITNGEEEFYNISPSAMITLQREEMEKTIKESLEKIEPKKKKLKFVNYWGTGTFEVFRLVFGDFKFIFFNFGFEMI
jgi:hypothetical protein